MTKRSVRDRFKLIEKKFKRRIGEEESLSGTDVEPASELDQNPEEICALEESFTVEATDSKQAKAE